MNIKDIDTSSVEFRGIDTKDYPDFADAYISYAETHDGHVLTDDERDQLQANDSTGVYELLMDYLY
jgi:hypothetical protein